MHTQQLALAQILIERSLIERGLTARQARDIAARGTYSIVDDTVIVEIDGHRAVMNQPDSVVTLAGRVSGETKGRNDPELLPMREQ